MIARQTARNALEPLWQAMVELAEWGNDRVVESQRLASSGAPSEIGQCAGDLAVLAQAAATLARLAASDAP